MDKKIELIEDKDTGKWHWVILKWDVDQGTGSGTWFNAGSGIGDSYMDAAKQAQDNYTS